MSELYTLHVGDALTVLRTMPDASVDCIVTSPPYWGLRDYGTPPVIFGGDLNKETNNHGTHQTRTPTNPACLTGGGTPDAIRHP